MARRCRSGVGLAALLALLAAASGCGELGGDTKPTAQTPVVSQRDLDRYPPGSPARAFLGWFQALQKGEARELASLYVPSLGLTPETLARQRTAGAYAIDPLAPPIIEQVDVNGSRARVLAHFRTGRIWPNGRVDYTDKQVVPFELQLVDGRWLLASNSFVELVAREDTGALEPAPQVPRVTRRQLSRYPAGSPARAFLDVVRRAPAERCAEGACGTTRPRWASASARSPACARTRDGFDVLGPPRIVRVATRGNAATLTVRNRTVLDQDQAGARVPRQRPHSVRAPEGGWPLGAALERLPRGARAGSGGRGGPMSWSALDRVERAAVAVGAAGLLVAALVVAIGGAPVAWVLLAFCGALSAVVLFIQMRRGRFFEPLTVLAAVGLTSFAARPLDLFLSVDDLQSWHFESSDVERLLRIDNQETALFVTRELQEGLEPALTRAIAAVAIFLGLALIGYLLPWGRSLASRLSRVGAGYTGRMDVPVVVGACLLIALVGQIAVLVKVGGLSGAANNMLHQKVLDTGLAYQTLLGFGTVGLLVWAAWSPPRTTRARVAFLAVTLEVCAYYAVAGTRTRGLSVAAGGGGGDPLHLAPVAAQVGRGRLPRRGGLRRRPPGHPPGHPRGVDKRGDHLGTRLHRRPARDPQRHDRVRQPLPRDQRDRIGARVPPPRAIPLRRGDRGRVLLVRARQDRPGQAGGGRHRVPQDRLGERAQGGPALHRHRGLLERLRLPGGDRRIAALRPAGPCAARPRGRGRHGCGAGYRAVLYALGLVVFYMELTTTYAVALGFVITLLVPFLVATLVLGRTPGMRITALAGRSA